MPGETQFLKSIRLRNVLSFGPSTPELELRPLNVLIGPNGSGKSNLVDAISLLRAAPYKLTDPIQAGGGINEWLWKGSARPEPIEISVSVHQPWRGVPLRHCINLAMIGQRPEVVNEVVENRDPTDASQSEPFFYYRFQEGRAVLNTRTNNSTAGIYSERELPREDLPADRSVLFHRRDPELYPEITYLANKYAAIRTFSEWNHVRTSPARRPQPTDLAGDFLQDDASNLALVLNELALRSGPRTELVRRLKDADVSITDFSTKVQGGTIQLYLHYEGLKTPVPATRLSDGTYRYLCLLAVLCHPDPPAMVCLEEPELGLHPDLLPGLADLLVEASERMQLIVTTHSDTLVDGLSKTPESVVVCEKHEGATTLRRLKKAELSRWLKRYGLGQLWNKGEIGGNRW
jgi:predicted ATPase